MITTTDSAQEQEQAMASLKARLTDKTDELQRVQREATEMEKSKAHLELSLRSTNQRLEQANKSYDSALLQIKEQKRASSSHAEYRSECVCWYCGSVISIGEILGFRTQRWYMDVYLYYWFT